MSDKYIIRNCPVCEFSDWEECTGYLAEGYICNDIHTEIIECQDRTDCVMKQIMEKCQKEQKYHKEWQKETGFNYATTGLRLANDILQLLDIEEI